MKSDSSLTINRETRARILLVFKQERQVRLYPRMASLAALAMRNLRTRLAAI